MKLSEETLKILKNFASINPSILLRAGNRLTTRSIAGNIVAEGQIEEEFPVEFALYDLVEFLNTLKLFQSPILDFSTAEDNFMMICEEEDSGFKVEYTFANKKHIEYPDRRPNMGKTDISFVLDLKTLDSITKASNVMQLPHIIILPADTTEQVRIEVSDVKDRSSNKFSITLDGTAPEKKFKAIFKMDTFKMLPNTYNVSISSDQTSAFESDQVDYYIGLDVNSRF